MTRSSIAIFTLLVLFLFVPSGLAARPNIIVILADDVGFSDIGCYGSEIHTPNLDSLAANGLRFTQFYNTARCCPSRACLLTGLYPHQAGVGHMTDEPNKDLDGYAGDLNEHCVTIPQVLQPAGYATYMVGKWHVTKHIAPNSPKFNWPIQRGFEHYYGTILGAGNFFDPGMLTRDNTPISPFVDPLYKPAGTYYYTDALSDNACRFIDDHHKTQAEKPFFMYVAYTSAHWPMQSLEKDIAKYKGVYDGGYEPIRKARFEREKQLGLIDRAAELSPQAGQWKNVKNKEWEARCMEVYAAMLDNMDQGIGRIIATLKQTGDFDNTLILFMQDNGGNLENTGRPGNQKRANHPTLPVIPPDKINESGRPKQTREGWPVLGGTGVMPGPSDTFIAYGKNWGNVSNTPFREYKHFVHEGGISTPLIAHWPAGIFRKGELEKQPGHLIDIMATCIDVAAAQYPRMLNNHEITFYEGKSLLPAFAGQPIERDAIYWEHEGNRALRQGDWKIVAKAPAGKWELYNIAADRSEIHDLSSAQPQKTSELQTKWEAWAKRVHALPWPWKPEYGGKEELAGAEGLIFKLKMGDDFPKAKAPRLKDHGIIIEAAITKLAPEGVIVAQGGTAAGYSLYMKDGKLNFATRHDSERTVVETANVLPASTSRVSATLKIDGSVILTADGKDVATGNVPGPIDRMPQDGLQVGQDKAGAVGDYVAPFKFKGEIGDVTVRLTEE